MPSREELGKRLKAVRLDRGLTLKEVEVLSGVSMTHTSQIERGMTSPTIGALEKLAKALDKTASFFLEEQLLDETSFTSKGERNVLVNEESGVRHEGLTRGIPGGGLHFGYLRVTPVVEEPGQQKHVGEEAIYVVKGSLIVVVGEKRYRLKSGDGIHFRSNTPHAFFSNTRVGAEAIWVGTSPPVF